MHKKLLTLWMASGLLLMSSATVSANSEATSTGEATFTAGDLIFVEPDGEGGYTAGQGVPNFEFHGAIVPHLFRAESVGIEDTLWIFDGRGGSGQWRLDVAKSVFTRQDGLALEAAFIRVGGGEAQNRGGGQVEADAVDITTTPRTLLRTESRSLGLTTATLNAFSLEDIDGTLGLSEDDLFQSVLTWTLLDAFPNQ